MTHGSIGQNLLRHPVNLATDQTLSSVLTRSHGSQPGLELSDAGENLELMILLPPLSSARIAGVCHTWLCAVLGIKWGGLHAVL